MRRPKMVEACEKCHKTDVKLYPYWEWMLCYECRKIYRENDRINHKEAVKEDLRLEFKN
jgi:hypothetical protein